MSKEKKKLSIMEKLFILTWIFLAIGYMSGQVHFGRSSVEIFAENFAKSFVRGVDQRNR